MPDRVTAARPFPDADVIEPRRDAHKLPRPETPFRALVENATDIITILDRTGTIEYHSPATQRVLGYATDELVGTALTALAHPSDQALVNGLVSRALRDGGVVGSVEARFRHRDGSWRFLEIAANNLLEERTVGGLVVNGRDVTERRVAEEAWAESQTQLQQSQKLEAVGRLAGGVAHDINNMLTAVKGFSALMQMDLAEQDPLRNYVDEIDRVADRATLLTRQLLTFSRRQVVQPRALDLNAVVEGMEEMLRRLIGENLQFVLQLDLALGPIMADPGQVEQVLMNLVVNARDAMPDGGTLTLRTGRDVAEPTELAAGSRAVLLSVTDTGCGMDAATQAKIFEPFFTTKEVGKGTGLGLSTVYGIVQQSGGTIDVASAPGRGTTFNVRFPASRDEVETAPLATAAPDHVRGGKTILLVEDEPVVRTLARRILERLGYSVLEAGGGPEALWALQQHAGPIHLLLTDVVIPEMSGPELAEQITTLRPATRVLYISGYSTDEVARHGAVRTGVVLLQKPFSTDALADAVRAVLDA